MRSRRSLTVVALVAMLAPLGLVAAYATGCDHFRRDSKHPRPSSMSEGDGGEVGDGAAPPTITAQPGDIQL
jgi:hypothetical protein